MGEALREPLAFLVGLRAAHRQNESFGADAHVAGGERRDLASAQGAGPADEQQRPVAHAQQCRRAIVLAAGHRL